MAVTKILLVGLSVLAVVAARYEQHEHGHASSYASVHRQEGHSEHKKYEPVYVKHEEPKKDEYKFEHKYEPIYIKHEVAIKHEYKPEHKYEHKVEHKYEPIYIKHEEPKKHEEYKHEEYKHEHKYEPIYIKHEEPKKHEYKHEDYQHEEYKHEHKYEHKVQHKYEPIYIKHEEPKKYEEYKHEHKYEPIYVKHEEPKKHEDYKHEEVEYHDHPKYNFKYGVEDSHTGDYKDAKEERDGDEVKGEYSLLQPDGRKRIVHYTASKHGGFNAVVSYSGHAIHPIEHKKTDSSHH